MNVGWRWHLSIQLFYSGVQHSYPIHLSMVLRGRVANDDVCHGDSWARHKKGGWDVSRFISTAKSHDVTLLFYALSTSFQPTPFQPTSFQPTPDASAIVVIEQLFWGQKHFVISPILHIPLSYFLSEIALYWAIWITRKWLVLIFKRESEVGCFFNLIYTVLDIKLTSCNYF